MNHIIIGTAGHIDHGKTTLIRALTGRNTDRLAEEQRRGISIDLGFTYVDLPSGARAGIIDVPGHERFIKNMMAGASGIDLVMLTVAANEGVKPQTIEHIDILSYLGIKQGLIVLTKADISDETLTELAIDDIRERTAGTLFEGAEIVKVDSVTGRGIGELVERIDALCALLPPRNTAAAPRLGIDRVFSLKGFGTVVTGTLAEGTISLDDELCLYPTGADASTRVKIRGIQVHDCAVTSAYAGQRTAINISNVKPTDLRRGDVLARAGSLAASSYIDVKLSIVPHAERELKFWERVRLAVGAAQVFARVVLLDADAVSAGETAYAQLRLEERLALKKGDRFVIRRYSPMETIGGGLVLDSAAVRHAKLSAEKMLVLASKESGSEADIAAAMKEQATNELRASILSLLEKYHAGNNMRAGILKEEVHSKLAGKTKRAEFDSFLEDMRAERLIDISGNIVAMHGFEPNYSPKQAAARDEITARLTEAGFAALSPEELTSGGKHYAQVLEALIGTSVVRLDKSAVMHVSFYEEAKAKVAGHLAAHGEITLAEFRDITGSSRKYAMLLLDDFDRRRITKRVGDKRVAY